MRPEDYWLHSSPSSFNEDLRRKNGWRREKKDRCERKAARNGGEEKWTTSARFINEELRSF